MFAGGADEDRAAVMGLLISNRIKLRLHGSYWERYPITRGYSSGQAELPVLRKAIAGTKVALCLVRRANRDGHCMRSFELPAVGSCMLVEKTAEHVELFGSDGSTVRYFETDSELLAVLAELLRDDGQRRRLASAAHELIVNGPNRYQDRLQRLLTVVSEDLQIAE
jgi:hypothetical protein